MYLVAGLMAGLLNAQSTGKGTVVDAAIYDGSAHMMNLLMSRAVGVQLAEFALVSYQPLAEAFRAALPEAETELDKIANQARDQARTHAANPAPLLALVDRTRTLGNKTPPAPS